MNHNLTRRDFLKSSVRYSLLLSAAGAFLSSPSLLQWLFGESYGEVVAAGKLDDLIRTAPRARFWATTADSSADCTVCHDAGPMPFPDYKHSEDLIKCLLCAQECTIRTSERGKCRTRINIDGELRTLSYGHPISMHIDPIEKKPFYHFLPGTSALSIATAGCPLHCKFCQNWELSQSSPEDFPGDIVPPGHIVSAAKKNTAPIIAYTYNEPTVFTEYLLDIAELGRKQGRRSVLISCGFMKKEPLQAMCDGLDAIKIDLKGFSREFYRNVCDAELEPVLSSIRQVAKSSTHLEIVNLVVPTLNDSDKMLNDLCDWVMGEVGPDVPLHFTRFHPDYQMLNLPPTPIATLVRAREIAIDKGIHYPFVGNVPGHAGNNTICPRCKKTIVERQGYFIRSINVVNGKCRFCKEPIAGVWN